MAFTLDYRYLVGFLLALARCLAWLLVVPPFANRQTVPVLATLATGVGLSLLVAPQIPAADIPSSAAALVGGIVVQVLSGIALGFLVAMLVGALTTAGTFVDQMGGFNLPPAIDPLSLGQTPILGQMYEQVTIIMLFVSGGYLVMIEGFVRSFQAPSLDLGSLSRLTRVFILDFATYFLSALEIAAPLLAVLFATQVILALLTKAAPQMNVWLLGLPIQIFLAMLLVAIGFNVIPSYLANLLTRAVGDGARLFGG